MSPPRPSPLMAGGQRATHVRDSDRSGDLWQYGFGLVDAFRFVNLIATDRMQSALSSLVAPGETGPSSTTLPNPGPLASFTQYGNSTFDPDPLYVGVVSSAASATDGGAK